MCLAVPAKVIEIKDQMATVEVEGVSRVVSALMVPDLKLGDYVIAHAGFALHVVDEKDALESIEFLRQLAQALPEEETDH